MATNIRINYDVIFNDLIKARKEIVELQKSNDVLRQKNKTLGDSFNKLNQQAKQTSGGMGNLRNNLVSLGAALGVTSGVFLFANALRNAGRTVVDFQKQNAVLAGVLNTNIQGVSRLTDSALQLGATTSKTASQVTQLQIALARLGFKQQDIIDLTPGLINGSVALNSQLDETAELVGAIVKTFDAFEAVDAPQIVDELTVATQNSALSFNKLQTAIPIVAGAAEQAGIPLNRLLALLGKLADAGIDTSTSATALRNIFIQSAGKGRDYNDILTDIATSTDKLTASTDAFGVRAAVSAGVISKQLETVGELEETILKAGGTAERVAETNLNTLQGRIDLLTSAYEGFILSIENGEGPLADFANLALEGITNALGALTPKQRESAKLTEEQEKEFKQLAEAASLVNKEFARTKYDELTEKNKNLKESISELKEEIEDNKLQASTLREEFFRDEKTIASFDFKVELLNGKLSELELELIKNEIRLKGFGKALKETNKSTGEELSLLQKLKEDLKEEVRLRKAATSEGEIRRRNIRIEQIKEEIERLQDLGNQLKEVGELEGLDSIFFKKPDDPFGVIEGIKEVNKKLKKGRDEASEYQRKKDQEDLEEQSAIEERKQQLLEQGFNFANDLQNRLTQNAINNARREFEVLELQKEAELDLAGDNADQRAKIEEKFAQKAIEAKIREAKAEKVGALFSIAINTAAAIIKQLAATPLPFGAPLVAAIAATGAAQGAVVAAQPLPKFRQGGQVGGRRHEQGGTLIEAEKGEFILRREAVDKYGLPMLESLNNMNLSPSLVVMNDNKELAKLFKERPENKLIWDENGFQSYTLRKGNIIQKKAKRYSI